MRLRDVVDLLLLAALWGGSFLFMRVAAPEFPPPVMVVLRVGIAAACLMPVLAWRGGLGAARAHAGRIAVVGLINSALPFCLFAYAALSLTAGFAALLNATTPLWGALVAYLWLGETLNRGRIAGLALGVVGVAVLVMGGVSFKAGGSGWAVLAVLAAALCYGLGASYTKRKLTGVNSLAVAAGSQLAACLALLPAAAYWWPEAQPSAKAWLAVAALGLGCTGLAYVLFFRLIANVGPAKAITVTFLVPVFAAVWGVLFLDEPVSGRMLAAGAIILLGTALATGLLKFGAAALPQASGAKP
ncbi:MAG: DMT family transporter [Gammaproteobacteria bacterium]|nr:DMT family transporter [Gammaproteobacteria bacterium]